MSIIADGLKAFWNVFAAMSPWLLVGFLIAGMIAVWLPRPLVMKVMGSHLGLRGVLRAVLIGVPLPICSCGVIPIATALRKAGAGKGPTAGFLIATPQTGIDSILATYALLGPFFAIARPVAAFLTGIIGGGAVKKGYVLRQSKAQAKAEQAAGITASNTGDLVSTKVQQQVAAQSGRYSCVVGTFGYAANFQAYRYIPDAGVATKLFGGALGVLGARNKDRAAAGAVGNLLSDNSRNQRITTRISHGEWRGIAERAFAAHPARFDVHSGIDARLALQNGIRYAVNGNVSQLYEKDGQCTVTFVLTMTDLENNGSIVFSKDVVTTVPGAYAGQSTFAQAIANGVAIFIGQLK